MYRLVLILLTLCVAWVAAAQPTYPMKGHRTGPGIPVLTYCPYGDSLTMDASGTTGSPPSGKGDCDYCDVMIESGWTIISIGTQGSEASDDVQPEAVAGSCLSGSDIGYCSGRASSGEQMALLEDTSCPAAVTSSCRDIYGDATLDQTHMDALADYCDVFGFNFGTNDASENAGANDFDAVHQRIIEKAASLGIPVVFWESPSSWFNPDRDERKETIYRPERLAAIAAVTEDERAYVSVFSVYEMMTAIQDQYGDAAERTLFDDCGPGSFNQALWDAGSNQTGNDCTHLARSTVAEVIGEIPADWVSRAMRDHIAAVYRAHTSASASPPSGGAGVWDTAVWDTDTWGS